jgi:hypothetical protein
VKVSIDLAAREAPAIALSLALHERRRVDLPNERKPDPRRHPRARVAWPVVVEAGTEVFQVLTVDVSSLGAKLATTGVALEPGTLARLHFRPPEVATLDVQALVWRTDPDGQAFFFVRRKLAFPTETAQPDFPERTGLGSATCSSLPGLRRSSTSI